MAPVVDLRGLECPEPMIVAAKVILSLPPGDSRVFLVDSEACAENIRVLASAMGVARVSRRSGYFEVVVSRGSVF